MIPLHNSFFLATLVALLFSFVLCVPTKHSFDNSNSTVSLRTSNVSVWDWPELANITNLWNQSHVLLEPETIPFEEDDISPLFSDLAGQGENGTHHIQRRTKVAAQRQCIAARPGTIASPGVIHELLYTLEDKHINGWYKKGQPLPGRKMLFVTHRMWSNFVQGQNHCARWCLGPAVSWGFDAAFCQLSTHGFKHRVTFIMTPDLSYKSPQCHVSWHKACPDLGKRTHGLRASRQMLRDRREELAKEVDMWKLDNYAPGGRLHWKPWILKFHGGNGKPWLQWAAGYSADPEWHTNRDEGDRDAHRGGAWWGKEGNPPG